MREEIDKLRGKKPVKQKGTSTWWFKKFSAYPEYKWCQKLGDSLSEKACSREKAKDAAGQCLVEEIRCVTHRSTQSPQGSWESRWNHPRKIWICGRPSCLMVWIPVTYAEDPQSFWDYIRKKCCQLGLKETELWQHERRLLDSQNSTSRKQADKTSQLQTCATLQERRGTTQGWCYGAEGYEVVLHRTIPRPWNLVKSIPRDYELT